VENLKQEWSVFFKPMFREIIEIEDEAEFKIKFNDLSSNLNITHKNTIINSNSLKTLVLSEKKYVKFCFQEINNNEIDYLIQLSNLESSGIEIDDPFYRIENESLKEIDFEDFKTRRKKFKNNIGKKINTQYNIPNTEIITYSTVEIKLFIHAISQEYSEEFFYGVEFLPIVFKGDQKVKYWTRNNRFSFSVHPIMSKTKDKNNTSTKDPGYDMGTLYP
jgi:hypothetical protein